MNTKTAVGIVVAILILVGAFFLLHKPAAAPVLPEQPVQTAQTASGTPVIATGTPAQSAPGAAAPASAPSMKVVSEAPVLVAAFDQKSLSSASAHPVLAGTSNTDKVGIVVDNAAGVGIVGSMDIATKNGRWSYTVPLALAAGTYTVHLLGGDAQVDAKLVVTR